MFHKHNDPRPVIRGRLSYANVTASLALFVALGGTAAAAVTLPRDSCAVIRGRELLRVARPLAAVNAGEARARSAVNRAYYAIFTEASRYSVQRGYAFVSGQGGSHQQMWRFFRGLQDGDQRRAAERRALTALGQHLKGRVRADYQTTGSLGKSEAKDAIREASAFIDRLDRLSP